MKNSHILIQHSAEFGVRLLLIKFPRKSEHGIKNLLPTIYKKSRVQNHSIEMLPSHGQDRGPSEYFCASKTLSTEHVDHLSLARHARDAIHDNSFKKNIGIGPL